MRENFEKVLHRDLLDEIEAVFTKDAVEDIVTVVRVRDALHPKLDRRLHCHVEGKEKPCIRQHIAESVDKEKENCDELRCDSPADELGHYNLSSSMGQSPVSKEEIGQPVQVLHLYICTSQDIRLLIVLNQAHCDVCLPNRELVCLL